MKTESEINVFVNGVLHYFNTSVQQVAECGTPHLAIGRVPDVSDYTGMIKISGKRNGMVFFTAPKGMLSVMLMRMQETDMSHDNLCDLVGEIAKTPRVTPDATSVTSSTSQYLRWYTDVAPRWNTRRRPDRSSCRSSGVPITPDWWCASTESSQLLSCPPDILQGGHMNHTVMRGLTAALGCMAVAAAPGQTPRLRPRALPLRRPRRMRRHRAALFQAGSSTSDDQKSLYTLGVLLSRNLDSFALTEAEFATVRQGFIDGYHHKPSTKDAENSVAQVQALQRARTLKVATAYLDKAAKAPGAVKAASGLIYIPVTEGAGASPARTDKVKVTYEGRLTDGSVFDSSALHGGSATFPLTGVIPWWTEALQRMKVGAKSRIVCPSQIAYGERGAPPKIRPGSTLEFDIQLLEIEPAPAAAPSAAPTSSSSGAAVTGSPP